ncbi:glycosyltransferase family 9 protein [Nibrella saemangeumensis]|uniref:Glycosyltransferase family 9 protein n=1 Tax=Nibrella saemangeumensis TaxID=1084526 RepID=A0ABP8NG62_9BACT
MITTSFYRRFLIIQTAFIGDVILATALLEEVRHQFPEAVIDMMVRKGNESLLANHPHLNDVLIWHKKEGKYRSLYRLLRTVRHRQYDAIINLQRFGATGLLTALSKANVTIGFDKNPFSRFYTHAVPHRIEPGVHEVDRNAALMRPLGNTPQQTRPKLYPSPTDYEAVRYYQQQSYVCIAPTSVWFTKQYPEEKWVDLIQQLPAHHNIYLLGAPNDSAACARIAAQANRPNIVNLAGKLSLLQSAALMQGAAMNYVNDSAPMHMASAMNAPTTAIFCSTVPQFGFGPLADHSRTVEISEQLDCKPCNLHGRKACPLGHFRCAHGIRTEQLLA